MTSTAQRMRGLLALGALAVLIGGVPWALWTITGGAPWEGVTPPSQWLTTELDSSTILSILTIVMWLAWAYFVCCVAVEAVRAVRHRPAPARGVGAQPLARRLVAAVMLLVGTATVTTPVATATTAADSNPNGMTSLTSQVNEQVQNARETSANANGTAASLATSGGTAAQHGGQQTAQASRGLAYLVQPPQGRHHDSLWDIAERTLGDGMRWTEIYQLNKGRVQADGNRLVEPDLIYPGWRMILPDDAKGPNVIRPPVDNLDGSQGAEDHQSSRGETREGAQAGQYDSNATADDQGDATSATATSGAVAEDHSTLYAQLGLGGGLIAAGLLWGLRRQRGWNGGGPPGRGRPFEEEHRLRLHADRPAALFADRGLRTLGAQASSAGHPAAKPSAARLNAERLAIRFDGPPGAPLTGWSRGTDEYEWQVQPEALTHDAVDAPSAAPQFVCIGTDSNDQVLVNLATSGGVVNVTGDERVATDMARSLVIDLATHAWADVIEVLAVGFSEDLLPLGGGRLRQFTTIEEAIAHVRGTVQHRLSERVIVSAVEPTRTEAASLTGLATDHARPVGVFVCGEVERSGLRLSVNADGVVVPAGWGLALSAQRLPAASIPPLVSLYGQETVHVESEAPGAVRGFDPRLADPAARAVADVRLLGPLSVDAVGEIEPERRPLGAEIVTCLALHPDGVHQRVLEGFLWPRGAADDVVSAAMEHTQEWLTPPAGEPAMYLSDGRWFLDLSRVRVDWHVLQMCRVDPARAGVSGLDALRRVTGSPLSELPQGRYAWMTAETTRKISETIVDVAERTAAQSIDIGDHDDAIAALRQGLGGVPDAEVLWRRLLRATAAGGTSDDVALTADEMFATLGRYGSPRGPEGSTLALVDDLLPNYRGLTA